jgi:hypothetical protein
MAFLIAQLILLEHQRDLEVLTREHIRFRLGQGPAGRISPHLRNLVLRLLEGEELSWGALRKELEQLKSNENIRPSFCLRLEEDISLRESEIQVRESKEFVFQKVERQQVLYALQPNLVASPIESLSRGRHR